MNTKFFFRHHVSCSRLYSLDFNNAKSIIIFAQDLTSIVEVYMSSNKFTDFFFLNFLLIDL